MTQTLEAAINDTNPAPAPLPEVKFSWGAVLKRWKQNLKDDIDPALTGAKIGFYAPHAIPTWHREYREGKLRTESRLISTAMAGLVLATEAGAYWLASKAVAAQTGSEMQGYAVFGVPLIANGLSWGYEAFRSAKKTEHSRVVMTRVQRSFDSPTGTYDLTNAELVDKVAESYAQKTIEQRNLERAKSRHRKAVEHSGLSPMEVDFDVRDVAQADKTSRTEQARQDIMAFAAQTLGNLYADGTLGHKYELTSDLLTGPVGWYADSKRKLDYKEQGALAEARSITASISKIVLDTVKSRGGKANIELLGEVTAIYGGERDGDIHYSVKPNKVWK